MSQILVNIGSVQDLGIKTWSAIIFHEFSMSISEKKWGLINNKFLSSYLYINFEKAMSNFVVSIVFADGLAPLGARPSAAKMMTKFESQLYTGPVLKELIYLTWLTSSKWKLFGQVVIFLSIWTIISKGVDSRRYASVMYMGS